MWHTSHMVILLPGFLYETTLSGEDQVDTHIAHSLGRLIEPAGRELEWIGEMYESLHRGTFKSGGDEGVK